MKYSSLVSSMTIGGCNVFYSYICHFCFILVDGIYPEIARFVKTISEPLTPMEHFFSAWQESSRKDIERAFGVLQRKFHFLVHSVELWYADNIHSVVMCCLILHNMMVEYRVECDEREAASFYETVEAGDSNDETVESGDNALEDEIEMKRANADLQARILLASRSASNESGDDDNNLANEYEEAKKLLLPVKLEIAYERWNRLYDRDKHYHLQKHVMASVYSNRK